MGLMARKRNAAVDLTRVRQVLRCDESTAETFKDAFDNDMIPDFKGQYWVQNFQEVEPRTIKLAYGYFISEESLHQNYQLLESLDDGWISVKLDNDFEDVHLRMT